MQFLVGLDGGLVVKMFQDCRIHNRTTLEGPGKFAPRVASFCASASFGDQGERLVVATCFE